MAEPLHGGRVHALARESGLRPEQILDFSANLNPLGPPASVLRALRTALPEALAAYPDAEAPRLRAALCARFRAADHHLVLGNGGASLLLLALRALAPRRMLVPEPCFREQPRALAACGIEAVPLPLPDLRLDLERLNPGALGCDGLLLTNPHNPTGQLLSSRELGAWITRHPELKLVVDEAFMDYAPAESLLPEILERSRTVVLRSLTKFYAMPGLRIGHAFADAATARRMVDLQEAWPVGQLELLGAEAALGDTDFEVQSLETFATDLPRFQKALAALPQLKPHPSSAPFLLVRLHTHSGTAVAENLRAQGLMVRTCAEWPGLGDAYLRLALRRPREQDRLIAALHRVIT